MDECALVEQTGNPELGRHIDIADSKQEDDCDLARSVRGQPEELGVINLEAHELEKLIAQNVARILSNQ